MADELPEFDVQNVPGSTQVLSGTTDATPGNTTSIPAVAGNQIEMFELFNTSESSGDVIQLSMDGGTTFYEIDETTSLEWAPKSITQLVVKSTNPSVPWRAIINFEGF